MELEFGCLRFDPYSDRKILEGILRHASSPKKDALIDEVFKAALCRRLEHYLKEVDQRRPGEIGDFATTIPEQPFIHALLERAGIDIGEVEQRATVY